MKYFTTAILLFLSLTIFAQKISVKSFGELPSDMEARVANPVTDQNGDKCALIKVVTTQRGFEFEGGTLGIMKTLQKTGEIWVYVPKGAKKITIKHSKLGVLRNYLYPVRINEAVVYEMVLTTAEVKTIVVEREILSEWLIITSEPEGADVYIDDKHLGQTPFQQELKEGKYTYRIVKDLYHNEAGQFDLSVAEDKKKMNFVLRPNFGYAKILSLPESGASIILNGNALPQTTPFTTKKLKSGEYTATLNLPMYYPAKKTFTVADGQTTDVSIEMQAAFGGITINTTPENGAEVSIDGQPTGKTTPCTLTKIASGEHTITLRRQWYEPKSQKMIVTDGKSQTLNIRLTPTFGEININTTPEADIYIDNKKQGNGTYAGRIVVGLHTFEGRKAKHTTDRQKLEIVSGEQKQITLAPKPMFGILKIVSTPFDARYTVKSAGTKTLTGTTPTTLRNLLVGTYTVELSKANHASITKTIEITEGQISEINETLSSGKKITINSTPTGASLYINGQYKGTTPYTLQLPFGRHTIKLQKDKHIDLEESININSTKSSYTFTLKSKTSPNYIFVKGGTFQMGSNDGSDREKPVHTVTVSDFYIGKYEVTQKQWREVMGNNPSYFKNCDDCPVEQVSWNDVQEFIKKLNTQTGQTYRLPTEAEWEYAALGKGGKQANTKGVMAWHSGNSKGKSQPVGTSRANRLGLFDMQGNAAEWCWDYYSKDYYYDSPENNPKGPETGTNRVYRGGIFNSAETGISIARRYNLAPSISKGMVGIRLVRSKD